MSEKEKELKELYNILNNAWKDIVALYKNPVMTDEEWQIFIARISESVDSRKANPIAYQFARDLSNTVINVAEQIQFQN